MEIKKRETKKKKKRRESSKKHFDNLSCALYGLFLVINSSTQSHFVTSGTPCTTPTPNFITSDMPCTTSTPNVSKRKLKSEVWKYFNRIEKLKPGGTKDIKVVCIACGDELAGALIAGIIHLKLHHT